MHSIYHFFHSLAGKKEYFKKIAKLDQFPFSKNLLACRNAGVFPDLAIRLNKNKKVFTGGELIELKDSDSYAVSSFNSTIPSGSKRISEILAGKNSIIKKQMERVGNEIFSLPTREVYYLIRGRKNNCIKICLVHGSFFETVSIENLISQSFLQVLRERSHESKTIIPRDFQKTLTAMFSQQQNFSKVRNVDRASVKLRFRIMTEVKAEGNILNSKKYPEIQDNTLNFVLACHSGKVEKDISKKLRLVFGEREMEDFRFLKLKHHFNGYFFVVQIGL